MSDSAAEILLPECWPALVTAARQVRSQAYAAYSNFAVGASVLTVSGDVFVGCNVENASWGLTICAERSAMCSAVAAGQREVIAACVSLTGDAVPCGACRQFLHEFNPNMLLLLDQLDAADNSPPECVRLSDLLPRAFRLKR